MVSNTSRGGGSSGDGGAALRGSSLAQGLKKGPWTAAEDAILMNYVKKHGEGNWNAVQRYSGLMRCGKSCRLRWANHLRPNLKKGAFSPEEERIIIELHAKLGNKWARMAAQLPGRTDNEIKNYWNTRLKRRQRAGLPIYPQEIQEKTATFNLHHQQQQFRHKKHHNHRHNSTTISSSTSPTQLLSSLLASPQNPPPYNINPPLSLLNFSSPHQNSLQNHQQIPTSFYNNTGFSLPVSPYYHRQSPVNPFTNQNIPSGQEILQPPTFQFNNISEFQRGMSFSSMVREAAANNNNNSVEHPIDFLSGLESTAELPSNQIPPPPPPQSTTPTNSSNSSGVGICGMGVNKTGLLDDLVQEGQKLARGNGKTAPEGVVSEADEKNNGKGVMEYVSGSEEEEGVESVMMGNSGDANADNQWDDLSSSFESVGLKGSEEPLEEMNSMDEDLMNLIHNFPLSSMPVPEWYPIGGTNNINSNGPLPTTTLCGGNGNNPNPQPNLPPATTMEAAASTSICPLGPCRACNWNNLPRIC